MANPVNRAADVQQALKTQRDEQSSNLSTSIVDGIGGFFAGIFGGSSSASTSTSEPEAKKVRTLEYQDRLMIEFPPNFTMHPSDKDPESTEQRMIAGASATLAITAPIKGQKPYADAVRTALKNDEEFRIKMTHIAWKKETKTYNILGADLDFVGGEVEFVNRPNSVAVTAQKGTLTVKIISGFRSYTITAALSNK